MGNRSYFATTSKGLEAVLAGEVGALGGKDVAETAGGVSFRGDFALGYRANLWLRTAHRVLLPLSRFPAATPGALYEGVKEIAWPKIFSVRKTIAVDATVRDSGISHSRFAAQKAKDAVADRFREELGARPDVNVRSPEVRLGVRIVRDECVLSLDLSGESLTRRGYRGDPEEASLKETLAAGIIHLSGWNGRSPLVDPMCGAGTIPIEAALFATDAAPGLGRRTFSFRHHRDFDRALWEALVEEAQERRRPRAAARIEGMDASTDAVRRARKNAAKAGASETAFFRAGDIRDFSPQGPPGIILCNPPYGVRMHAGGGEKALYGAMGEAFKKRCRGWTAYVLSGDPAATRHIGLKASRKFPLMNGPIDCRLLRYDLY